MNTKKLSVIIGALALLGGFVTVSQAQVATGPWTSWSPSYNTQTAGSGSISGTTFSLSSSSASGEHRAERRYVSFSSGSRQFEGTVKVNSLGGDRICLKQTFQDGTGPWNMIAVKKPGSLYEVQGGATLASYTIGSSVRINTVSYTGSRKVVVYINGSMVETITDGTLPFYDKLGAYRTNSGNGPVSVTWSNIRFWQK
jgi:hypothetical protein